MLSIRAVTDPEYYLRGGCGDVEKAAEPEAAAELDPAAAPGPADYELDAVSAGEPPGRWAHRGTNPLGVKGEIVADGQSGDDFRKLLNQLRDPRTGEALGSRPRNFPTTMERLGKLHASHPGATAEQLAEMRLEAEKGTRHANHGWDLTFSPPKSWSVLHAALQRDGRHDEAEKVQAALDAGMDAALTQAWEEHGWTRVGIAGPKVAGKVTTTYVRAENFVLALFRHHTSRERDPQLHSHAMLLARVQTADGKWRALWPTDLLRSKHQLDATFLRVAEATLSQSLGVRFATRPDGKAREIVGVSEQVRELFSVRSRAVSEAAQELIDAYTARYGQAPDAYRQWQMNQQATLDTRRAKPKVSPTREEDLARWEAAWAEKNRSGLLSVLNGVKEAMEEPLPSGRYQPALVIEQALADLGQRKATWSRSHLYQAIANRLPDMLAVEPARIPTVLSDLASQALSSQYVVPMGAPPVAAVPPSLQDEMTGRSVFEAPDGARFTTSEHLRREDSLISRLDRRGAPTVDAVRAERALKGFELSGEQRSASLGILTSDRRVHLLVAPAGSGKSRTMAGLSHALTETTGHGLVGLTSAQNAAEVLAAEGVERAFNIAAFLTYDEREQRGEASDVERATFAVPVGATVVLEEASMISTPDMVRTFDVFDRMGVGKLLLVGDTEQMDAVDAGGGFAMLVDDARKAELEASRPMVPVANPHHQQQLHTLSTVHRFTHDWERDASSRIRAGDATALTQYDARRRVRGGDSADEVREAAVLGFVLDHLSGQESIVVTGTSEDAADVSSRVREHLAGAGHVSREGVRLHDETTAGVGDLVQTRQNDRTLAGGPVFNRELWQVVATTDSGDIEVRRALGRDEHGERKWGPTRALPAGYVAASVELGYAATVHGVEGRTVDTSHTLVDQLTGKAALYVGSSRGREANTIYVIPTQEHADKLQEAQAQVDSLTVRVAAQGERGDVEQGPAAQLEQAQARLAEVRAAAPAPLGRVAEIVESDERAVAARTAIAEEQDRADHLGNLGPQWQTLVAEDRAIAHRETLREVLGEQASPVLEDRASPSLLTLLRSAEMSGHDPREVLGRAMEPGSLDGARSPASVLFARVDDQLAEHPQGPEPRAFAYVDRTPAPRPGAAHNERLEYARAVAKGMDDRVVSLVAGAADEPAQEWALDRWGPAPEDPDQRAGWRAQVGVVQAYREQFGWNDPKNAIGPQPSRAEPERAWVWGRAADVLGMDPHEREMSSLSRGELANREQHWEREQAWMPRNVDADLREAHRAHDETRLQVVEARGRGEETVEHEADRLAMEQRVAQLEEVAGVRAQAYEATREARERAEGARAELSRRDDVDRAREGREPAAATAGPGKSHTATDAWSPPPASRAALVTDGSGRIPDAVPDRGDQVRADLEQARAAAMILVDRQAAELEPTQEQPREPDFVREIG